MDIFPAIDLRNGSVVRLTQGDYQRMDVYETDAAAVARRFADAGAAFLHVVDLDGAKDGALSNYDTIQKILNATQMFVEVGGGIRDEARIEAYLARGVGRVILGTAALEDFDFLCRMVRRYGEKIAVGVDAKNGKVATAGWLEVSDVDGVAFCKKIQDAGVQNVIYTDIAKDGAMQGINREIYQTLAREVPKLHITASGGVSALEDIVTLRDADTNAAIVGKALYIGALDLSEVLRVARGENI